MTAGYVQLPADGSGKAIQAWSFGSGGPAGAVTYTQAATLCDSSGTERGTSSSPIYTQDKAPTTPYNGKKTVTTAGTSVALATTQAVQGVTVKALVSNTGLIYVGDGSVASSNGYQLSPGESVSLAIADLASVHLDSAVNGEGVTYIGVN